MKFAGETSHPVSRLYDTSVRAVRCAARASLVVVAGLSLSGCITAATVATVEDRPVAVPGNAHPLPLPALADDANTRVANPVAYEEDASEDVVRHPVVDVTSEPDPFATDFSNDADAVSTRTGTYAHTAPVRIETPSDPGAAGTLDGEAYGRLIDPGNAFNLDSNEGIDVASDSRNQIPLDDNRGLGFQLTAFAQQWQGVRYRWGGNDRRGIDCSGLVLQLYKELFDISLPRTTRQQIRTGKTVKRKHLAVGDLVFFRLPRNRRHVGVFMGDGKFLHASLSRGVVVSSLDKSYWRRHYQRAVRPTGRSI